MLNSMIFLVVATLVGIGNAGENLRTNVIRRRLAQWTECTKCDGRGHTKEYVARYGCESARECSRCNGDGGYYGVPAEIQAAMQTRKMQPFELAEECNISIKEATQYLDGFKPQHRRRLGTDNMGKLLNMIYSPCKSRGRKTHFKEVACAALAGSFFVFNGISNLISQKLKNDEPLTQPQNLLNQEISKTQAKCYEMAMLVKDNAPIFLELMKNCNASGGAKFQAMMGTTPTIPTDTAGQQKAVKEIKGKMEQVVAALKETNPAPEGQQPGAARRG
jgi:hypothetical protein